jgi:DNA-binding FadR family transcriptional regulator
LQGSQDEKGSAYDTVAIIELRLSLEVEAAAIAAQCASPSQLLAMRAALDEAHALDLLGEQSTGLDFEFHLQIAQCTANSFFVDAMTHLGSMLVSTAQQTTPVVTEQLRSLQVREREQIYAAVARQDVEAARAAMRLHLTNCLQRARSVVQSTAE